MAHLDQPSPLLGTPGTIAMPDGRILFTQQLDGPESAPTAPTIVFECGAASSRSFWALVQPVIGEFHRAVVYDRSGLGRSASATGARRLPQLADDLNSLLDGLGGDGRYILVGHSWGGPLVRLAAAIRPDRIAGLVLVDPADETSSVYYSKLMNRINDLQRRLFPTLSRTGLLGRLAAASTRAIPESVRNDMRRELHTPTAVATQIAEAEDIAGDLRALVESPPELGDLPITVISAEKPSGMSKEQRRELNDAHRRRAAASPYGRHVVAEQAGHLIMIDRPEIVVGEILRLARDLAAGA
ncbi:alpha/beta fold hydrolase [Propionibacteriaceae bacterium Y1700]|uniref:alpha/beta fold hydrolase n=1 Tax=Microlunatus sp. Y1700 TaxID=3418487 RepID=UPI003DA716AE